jgi:hypothetical protein
MATFTQDKYCGVGWVDIVMGTKVPLGYVTNLRGSLVKNVKEVQNQPTLLRSRFILMVAPSTSNNIDAASEF